MQKPVIKTYSRKQPVVLFKSSSALVPSYPKDGANNHYVRESRLNDQTLEVATFDDTFDRLATGVVIPSPTKGSNNVSNDSSDDKSSDEFKVLLEAKVKKRNKNVDQENVAVNKINNKPHQKENKQNKAATKKGGVKRKKKSESSDEDYIESVNIDKAKQKERKKANKKKKLAQVKNTEKVPEEGSTLLLKDRMLVTSENENKLITPESVNNLITLENANELATSENETESKIIEIENEHQNPSSFNSHFFKLNDQPQKSNKVKVNHLRLTNDFPTSTPRDDRLRKLINMQSISPILTNRRTENPRFLSATNLENQADEKHKETESNSLHNTLSENTTVFVKPQSIEKMVSNSNNNTVDDKTEETSNELQDKISESGRNKKDSKELLEDAMQNKIYNGNMKSNSNGQLLHATNLTNGQRNGYAKSFNESPLLFDDTHENQDEKSVNSSIIQNQSDSLVSKDFTQDSLLNPKRSDDALKKIQNHYAEQTSKENSKSYGSDFSFSLHEWSNEYETTDDFMPEKKNVQQNKPDSTESKLSDESDKNVENELSLHLEDSPENVTASSDVSDSENNKNDSIQNNVSNKENTSTKNTVDRHKSVSEKLDWEEVGETNNVIDKKYDMQNSSSNKETTNDTEQSFNKTETVSEESYPYEYQRTQKSNDLSTEVHSIQNSSDKHSTSNEITLNKGESISNMVTHKELEENPESIDLNAKNDSTTLSQTNLEQQDTSKTVAQTEIVPDNNREHNTIDENKTHVQDMQNLDDNSAVNESNKHNSFEISVQDNTTKSKDESIETLTRKKVTIKIPRIDDKNLKNAIPTLLKRGFKRKRTNKITVKLHDEKEHNIPELQYNDKDERLNKLDKNNDQNTNTTNSEDSQNPLYSDNEIDEMTTNRYKIRRVEKGSSPKNKKLEELNSKEIQISSTFNNESAENESLIVSRRTLQNVETKKNVIRSKRINNSSNKGNTVDAETVQNNIDNNDATNKDDNAESTISQNAFDQNRLIDKILNGKKLRIAVTKLSDTDIEAALRPEKVTKNKSKKIDSKIKNKNNKADIVSKDALVKQRKRSSRQANKKDNTEKISEISSTEIDKSTSLNENRNLKSKEMRLVLPRLEDLITDYESPLLSRRKQTIRKSNVRTSKSTVEHYGSSSTALDENRAKKSLNNKSLSDSIVIIDKDVAHTIDEINESCDGQELANLLSKLNDPIKITKRRDTFKKWDRPLAAITERRMEQPSNIIEEDEEGEEEHEKLTNSQGESSANEDYHGIYSSEEDDGNRENYNDHPIFLKPGKLWARSLSIISHFHNGQNLDEFAVGRGKNWRHSVQTLLNMQPEGNAKKSDEKESLSDSMGSPEPKRDSHALLFVRSPTRFSRRFSVRIIPSGKRSTLTDDFIQSRVSSFINDRTRKTSLARKTSMRIRRDTLIETEDDLIKSARDIILKRCRQTTYVPFSDCFPDSYIGHCRKIGEGVYGEVFLYSNKTEKSVIKIIPIEGSELVNCEPQKKFHEILSEIIIAEELHKLRVGSEYNTNGFVGVNRIMCVIGKYPEKLIDLWNAYDEEKKSENDCPSMFADEQLYIILELAHGGQDLEAFVFQNASESFSVFMQTAFTLAVAEQSLEFEHRDLHWGNILVSKTDDSKSIYKLGSGEVSLPTKGVKVCVIDFTLSRMSYQGCKIFNDLAADPALFTAQGEYQFDIYRLMRQKINNDWQQFCPFTNLLWLDYTLDKMITGVRYKKKTTKVHKNAIEQMKALRDEIFNYKSAYDFVTRCEKIATITNRK